MAALETEVKGRISRARARWSPLEIAFWVFAFATIWLFPGKHLILTETAILALFALSLDLILGYAGIISLGHAAFFGFAGYFAGPCRQVRHHQRAGALRWCWRGSPPQCLASSPAFWCCAAPT